MSIASKNCILFFVKDPLKGQVKRRLAAALTETIAVELYRNFILDMLSTFNTCKAQCLICFYPEGAQKKLKDWLGKKYYYLPQQGRDLGERMKNSFIEAFRMKFENAILIGSDIPDLPSFMVSQAFLMLERNDMVVGPARDGGYYLIGFRKDSFIPEVFDNITWGRRTVLRKTLSRLNQTGCNLHLLSAWSDVDTLADVMALLKRNKASECSCPRTISHLARIEDVLKYRP
jgi:hypothetical protein